VSEHRRGDPELETAISKFWRGRFAYGSLYVLDIDRVVCRPDLSAGLLLEEKHVDAADKTWRVTRELAHRLGWRAALLEYATSGDLYSEVGEIAVTVSPARSEFLPRLSLQPGELDAWLADTFGARRAA
jgi:hypothetical protein